MTIVLGISCSLEHKRTIHQNMIQNCRQIGSEALIKEQIQIKPSPVGTKVLPLKKPLGTKLVHTLRNKAPNYIT